MAVVEISDQHRSEDFSLSPRMLDALWTMEDGHFWHSARNGWILDLLRLHGAAPPRTMLDVGCGSGAVLRRLAEVGYKVTGVDTERRLIAKAKERCKNAELVVGDVGRLPASLRGPYSIVGFFDVLEHLDRPEELVAAALQWAEPGALVVATVPALGSLYSMIDDLSGHKRRYEPGQLAAFFRQLGLTEVSEYGIFRSSLAMLRLHRRKARGMPGMAQALSTEDADQIMIDNLKVPAAPINGLMKLVCLLERRLFLRVGRAKSGASLTAVGRLSRTPV